MSAADVDDYLAGLAEPQRSTLEEVRRRILEVAPDAEQCISYSMPAFKVQGKVVAGFAAFTKHLSYLPHSGSVLTELHEEVAGYDQAKGSLHFAMDQPLPRPLIKSLVTTKMRLLGFGA
jgi:uncharacterized protein YdhG (YjbR/CyaY superfamily)